MSEDPNSVHVNEAFKQPGEQNECIYEDIEKDEMRLFETAMPKDPDYMNAYETLESHSLRQSDSIYENPFAYNEEITKAEISNLVSAFQPPVRENPNILNTSTENTSSTT